MWRYYFTLLSLVLAFFLVGVRLFYWQVVRAEELLLLGQSQYGRVVKLLSERGEIKTSDGYPIVTNRPSFLVFANPKEISDKNKTIDLLSQTLEIDKASVSASLSLNRFWVPITNGITLEKKEEVQKLKIPGVGFEKQFTRFYPEASLAAHLVGFVGENDSGDDKGYFGLEGYYDRQLRGKERQAIQIRDAFGRPILAKADERKIESKGRTLILNIDRVIQFLIEQKLKEGVEKYQAAGGMIGVMDPKTGNILALSSLPSFDNRNFSTYENYLYKNPFISNTYEPGSTLKSLVMPAGIDSKVVRPDTKCPICFGPVPIADYEIRTWNNKYYKDTTMIEVIQHSDNTGMVYVSQKLGIEKMLSYLRNFGVGSLTGIDLEGEVPALIRPDDEWTPIDLATASFGQGISITGIQLLTAFSAIANKGVRMEPHVVSKIVTSEGEEIPIYPKKVNSPITPETAKIMTEILVNAVSNGEAKYFKPKGYRIAGKTGTAQIPIAGKYDPHKTIASFIGFAPADNPKFSMLVVINQPTTSIYGAETAAPIFFDIAKNILLYYGISPTE
ncbi:MAG: hypothetical protein A3F31_04655 [Candidatus Levybacteria bacterium RIFCSPHIGHO2_12_FULL_38_12]|nr:MAG: hypothetical protein A3D75_01250 [Candidatus Levybacteria bacterium RIFCSPHIGHO2_02_FULL_37_18]OGH22544.1 MAG: hypothetical protein A3F31_04655 [Candidatus Levybacteria bacterium RIFCSPHIGHO2_12_FULL_38_12]OGH33420.1 MAG: hypothetical protein A3A47_04200 [Candidatus Levybacteria bacterium RIFCSPLOWO2_01_FULL_37_20]OGH44081.1 MAG: hypothetical protein A3J14_05025 [Candidatus Levybacteria bacterium RIFCSPLOWO2_02_FULL_37_18]